MSSGTLIVLFSLLSAVVLRLLFLEVRVRSLQKPDKLSKNAHRFLNRLLIQLQRPLSGLRGVQGLYELDDEPNHKVGEYLEVVDHCASHLNFEIEKIRLLVEVSSSSYQKKSERVQLHVLIAQAKTMALAHLSEDLPPICIKNIPADLYLTDIDSRLMRAFILESILLAVNTGTENIKFRTDRSAGGETQLSITTTGVHKNSVINSKQKVDTSRERLIDIFTMDHKSDKDYCLDLILMNTLADELGIDLHESRYSPHAKTLMTQVTLPNKYQSVESSSIPIQSKRVAA